MLNIAAGILYKYPNANPRIDFTVTTNKDATSQTLISWNVYDINGNAVPQPSDSDLQTWAFSALQQNKINDLNNKCDQTIIGGFSSSCLGTSHQYQFDIPDQMNLNGQLSMMNADSTITSTTWKTLDAGVLTHTKAQFIQLCKDAFTFKQTQIDKYRNLKDQVNAATTEDAVNAITW